MNQRTKRAVGVWALVLMGAVLVAGCSIPKLSPKGKNVRLLKKVDKSLLGCARYSPFRVKAKSITSRDAQKRRNILARNSAADAGANAVVPISQPDDKGSQKFEAYQCTTLSAKGKNVRLLQEVMPAMGCTGRFEFRVEAKSIPSGDAQKHRNIMARNQAGSAGANVVVETDKSFRRGRVQIYAGYRCDKLEKTGKDGQ
ncbi:MAG: hypothetical protein V3S64_01705 [bacterium]